MAATPLEVHMNKKRTETRKVRAFHLTPGVDDDLLEWLAQIPRGEVEGTIRAALRAYKSRSQSDPVMRLEQSVSRLFADLPGLIRSELSKVAVVGTAPAQAAAPIDLLSADEMATRNAKLKKNRW
jgi:hypothetical protein